MALMRRSLGSILKHGGLTMELNNLIQDMLNKGIIKFASRGKASAVFNFIRVMAETRPMLQSDIKLEVN